MAGLSGSYQGPVLVGVALSVSDCAPYSSKYDAWGDATSWTSGCDEDCSFCTSITGTCLVTSEMPDCEQLK